MKMIDLITYGLGADLGKKIRLSFYNKERLLVKNDLFREVEQTQQDAFIDLLALSIFYEYAIGPLHGSVEFMNGTKQYGVKSINMGTYKYDDKMKKISIGITKGFYEILERYNIEISQLNIGSISEFIHSNIEYVSRVK